MKNPHAMTSVDIAASCAFSQVVHDLRYDGRQDLVRLIGGEQLPVDVAGFRKHNKRMVSIDGGATTYGAGDNPFAPKPAKAPKRPRKPAGKK